MQARPLLRVGIHHVGTDITQDAAGNFYGMETDFMQALGSYAGREVVFVPGTWEECRFRLERGEIDVISGIVKTPQREQTMRFSRLMMGRANDSRDVHGTLLPHRVNQLYFAVRRDDEALMQELDLAADQLIGNRPYFVSHLYQLYYGQRGSAELRLTEREQRFLKSHPVISAVVVAREAPFAYVDKEGNLQGTMKKLADRLERDLGIKLALVIEQDYAAAQEDLDKGRAQILLNADWDVGWAAAHNMDLSAVYLTSYYTTVTRRNGAPKSPRIACLSKRLTDRVLLERYEKNQIRHYATAEECLRAVSNGQADIELELTETAFDFDTPEMRQHALHVMHELHEMGFRLSIDDFGSGYSDLTILNAIPLDIMKIDRSLLIASIGAKRMQAVLARMIDLGHALGMTVICEGIEEHEQEEMLRSYGCDHGQGYLYGKPMPEAEFSNFLEQHT